MYIFPVINYVQACVTFKGQCFISIKSCTVLDCIGLTILLRLPILGGEWKDYINLEYSLSKPVRFWFSLKILFCNNTEHREQWQQKLVARCVILCSAILVGPNSLTKYTNMLHILRDSWQQAISVIESVTKWMFFLINVLSTELELNKLCS